MGRVMKRKICVYVSEELVTRLATAAEKRGATKSGLVGSALDRFLDITEDHDTSSSVDDRLARMGDQLDHLARELSVVNETVAMHARYHLAVTPPLSDTEQPAACRLGAARFDEFAAQVARRVRLGKPLFHETLERLEAQAAPLPSSDDESISGVSAERAHDATHDAIYNGLGETDRVPVPPGIARQISDRQAEDREQQPKKGQPSRLQLILRVFLPFAIGYYLSYLFRTISALMAGPLTDEFGLTSSTLGLLTSAYFLTFAAAQIPIGILLDRHGPRQVQAVLLVLAAGGAALFGAADGVFTLLAGRALIGLGVAAALTAGLKATVLWFPKEHVALVNGWMVMLGALGAVTATAPSEWLLAWIGWRGLFEWLAMATTVAAGIVYLLVPEARLRSTFYKAVGAGDLRVRKYGKRTFVTTEELKRFVENMPSG